MSRTLRETTATAAPETGVERLPYVPSPYGDWSVSPWRTSTSSGRDAQLLGDDLRERRLVALALRLRADADDRLARRVHPQVGAVVHREAEDVHVLARPGADAFREERDADAHQLAAGALLGLLAAQVLVAGDVHRDAHRLGVVAGVVGPAGRRLVRELLGPR